MKINIEIECTPDEARQACGLPDVKPLREAVMAKIEQQVLDAVSAHSPDALKAWLPYWLPMMSQSSEQFQKEWAKLFTSSFDTASASKK